MKDFFKRNIAPRQLSYFFYLTSLIKFISYKSLILNNKKHKNIHQGKRCFILGSSPSIKNENIKTLKNEIVFGLNNFYVHEDFATIIDSDVAKYYLVAPIHPPQTEQEWLKWFSDMEKHLPVSIEIFFGLNKYKYNIKYIIDKYDLFKKHKINWYFAGIESYRYYKDKINNIELDNMIWTASTASTYALISAIYMGFSEIYLLGVDCNYICQSKEENYRFYKNAIHQVDEQKRMNYCQSDRIFGTARIFLEKEIIARNIYDTKIYNCSSDSLLDMFEKKQLKDIL